MITYIGCGPQLNETIDVFDEARVLLFMRENIKRV